MNTYSEKLELAKKYLSEFSYRRDHNFEIRTNPFNDLIEISLIAYVECADRRGGWKSHIHFSLACNIDLWLKSDNARLSIMENLLIEFETHEMKEWLRFRGVKSLDPHKVENPIKEICE